MYCPNCGVEIHAEGSFCAKCRKNIAYLTQKKEAATPEAPPSGEDAAATETLPLDETPAAAAEEKILPLAMSKKGFYCNYCGTFVFPEDNFCYECGKKTRKEYYKPSSAAKKSGLFSFKKTAN